MKTARNPLYLIFASLLYVTICLGLSCKSHTPKSGTGVISSSPSLAEQMKRVKEAGLPTTPEELQVALPPESENAAPLYQQLGVLLKAKPVVGDDKIAEIGVGRSKLTADQALKLRHALLHHADITSLIHRAAERPQCVFNRKWSQGSSLMFPEFATMRLAVRWLSAESALQLYDGIPLDAVKTLALGFRIAGQAAQDPTIIAYLVALAADSLTLHGMERILYAAGEKPGVARAVQQTISSKFITPSLAHGLHGEIVFPLVEIERNRKASPEEFERSFKSQEIMTALGSEPAALLSADDKKHWGAFVDRSEAVYLQTLQALISTVDKPYYESAPIIQKLNADLKAHQRDLAYIMLRMMFPVYFQAVNKRAQMFAKTAMLEAAAVVLAWKALHAAFPLKLADAISKVPIDPFDGKPLRYKQEGTGFVVYSVGPTGKFDGGTVSTKPDSIESFFRYPIPAYIK